mgnify:FL=1
MKNFKLQTSIKFVLSAFAIIMAIAVLWINSTIISNLREGNRSQIEKIAEYYSKELSDIEKSDYTYFADVILPVLHNFEFPIIITNEINDEPNPDFLPPINIDIKEKIDSQEYKDEVYRLIKQMDENFAPYEITGDDGSGEGTQVVYHKIHYGDQDIIRTIALLPYLNFGFAILFITIAAFGIQLIRINERNSIYAGMAKETAHQLGTPISSLMGWVELLKERMLVKKRNKILSSMKNDLARLSEISDRFSKIGSKVNFKKVNLKSLLEKVAMYMSERLPRSSKTKIVLLSKNNTSLMGDAVLLSWAFENLIKNSIDAINPETGEIELSLINTDSKISIYFKDNGKGIKRKNWNDIFRPGFSTKKRGWGLGLSLTQRIIEDIHKGAIIVTDSSKDGTTIKITFNK